MVPDLNAISSKFTGKYIITDLDGNFKTGYNVVNGILIRQYQLKSNTQTTAAVNDINPDLIESSYIDDPGEEDCWGITCENDLEEVVINGGGSSSYRFIYIPWPTNVPNGGDNYSEDPGEVTDGGGGSSGSDEPSWNPITGECDDPSLTFNYTTGECTENPILGADCRSFEYAQPPGALQKACAVQNFDHNFYFFYFRSDGSFRTGFYGINHPIIYFTMPPGMTNGRAANLTASAVSAAILLTDAYVASNASDDLIEEAVADKFRDNIRIAMRPFGGNVVPSPPFVIPSPAPYLTSFFGAKTDCN